MTGPKVAREHMGRKLKRLEQELHREKLAHLAMRGERDLARLERGDSNKDASRLATEVALLSDVLGRLEAVATAALIESRARWLSPTARKVLIEARTVLGELAP